MGANGLGSSSNPSSRPEHFLVLFLVSNSNSRLCGNCYGRKFVKYIVPRWHSLAASFLTVPEFVCNCEKLKGGGFIKRKV